MSKKEEKYFPLQAYAAIVEDKFNSEWGVDLFCQNRTQRDVTLLVNGIENNAEVRKAFSQSVMDYMAKYRADEDTAIHEVLIRTAMNITITGLIAEWGKNKQVFKLDAEFANELAGTDNLCFVKDIFDFLPCKVMYIDLKDCPDIVNKINSKGIFLAVDKIENVSNAEIEDGGNIFQQGNVNKVSNDNVSKWRILVCAVHDHNEMQNGDKLQSRANVVVTTMDEFYFDNEDNELVFDNVDEERGLSFGGEELGSISERLLVRVATQTLMYLCSPEPDIKENDVTKNTYRKPNPNLPPKNKFSEIQQWDVGVRLGTAFRHWQESQKNEQSEGETGRRVRPHFRKAHWSTRWYGKKDGSEERVRRPVWISETFVNATKETELPAVVHETGKNAKKKTIDREER